MAKVLCHVCGRCEMYPRDGGRSLDAAFEYCRPKCVEKGERARGRGWIGCRLCLDPQMAFDAASR